MSRYLTSQPHADVELLAGTKVLLLGTSPLEGALTSFFLETTCKTDCTTGLLDQPNDVEKLIENHNPDLIIYSVNNRERVSQDCFNVLKRVATRAGVKWAVMNIESDNILESQAFEAGGRGFFYSTDSPDILLRGLDALIRGDIWIPRKVLARLVASSVKTNRLKYRENGHRITEREQQILRLISQGKSRNDIAEDLFISPHTVRTHIYNLYRKIGVNNRLQAYKWAVDNRHELSQPYP